MFTVEQPRRGFKVSDPLKFKPPTSAPNFTCLILKSAMSALYRSSGRIDSPFSCDLQLQKSFLEI
ncbi:hypothetical protein K469DRAFT_710215, partial [Zopfia rhizophila CBS 207.26]